MQTIIMRNYMSVFSSTIYSAMLNMSTSKLTSQEFKGTYFQVNEQRIIAYLEIIAAITVLLTIVDLS